MVCAMLYHGMPGFVGAARGWRNAAAVPAPGPAVPVAGAEAQVHVPPPGAAAVAGGV